MTKKVRQPELIDKNQYVPPTAPFTKAFLVLNLTRALIFFPPEFSFKLKTRHTEKCHSATLAFVFCVKRFELIKISFPLFIMQLFGPIF